MPDLYAVDAEFYDIVHANARDNDAGLWLSFAGRTNLPVLEVGTGTGRIALALAKAGHTVTAVDPSPAMLARARAKAVAAGLSIDFREGTALAPSLPPEQFGLAIVPADVFLYCGGGEAQHATLSALAAALAFNGRLALDLPGPLAWLDPGSNGEPLRAFAGATAAGERLEAWHLHDDDLALQERQLTVTYDVLGRDGLLRRLVSEHKLRYVYPFELEYLLERAGLELLGLHGDYELGPLDNGSERMIAIARRSKG